ncbi:aromatic amino acid transaminase [Tolumonas osonensis]|uniref:Aromatic-amino-acid transaminase n=1 Tax=Tolumonas osonensis TaxID=675874 RepID=A0A841GDS7_9GAMM|nr:amino acid aminotransferase [Tolumonas osonensis]MBB6054776.1 aromatic-amino-acid transaminase [Tolumonas osonensis]
MFQHVDMYAGDPILSLVDTFKKDPRAEKVNLGIGIYYDDAGNIPVLPSVQQAETDIAQSVIPRVYLPMEGSPAYRTAIQHLLFGKDNAVLKAGRVASIQSLGGSGALKVGADFLHKYFPTSEMWVSDPTWDNHHAIFQGAGIQTHTYPYYDDVTGGIKFNAMLDTFQSLPEQSIVLMHPCCHNPTGVDLSRDQWAALLPVMKERKLIPFLDIAYQGFGDSLTEDVFALQMLIDADISFFVSNSFSKNLSLYSERCGGLSVICPTAEEAERVLGQLKLTVRKNYSSPPSHGALVVTDVLTKPELRATWEAEVAEMRDRIKAMRQKLYETLTAKVPGKDFSYMIKQRGMFSYTGLTPEQVDRLREEFAVYLVRTGRMCVAGLNTSNVEYVANAMAAVLQD